MSFFDNWRVQLASINAYNPSTEKKISALETEYATANTARREQIFSEYANSSGKIQEKLVVTTDVSTTTGAFFHMMWLQSCQLYPELKVIDDIDTQHAILACRTKVAQDQVLNEFLERKKG